MSRRKSGAIHLDQTLHVTCACGRPLGKVLRMPPPGEHPAITIDPDPSAPPARVRYAFTRPLELRESGTPTQDSGKLAAKCTHCGADFQRRWVTVRDLLDQMAADGVAKRNLQP